MKKLIFSLALILGATMMHAASYVQLTSTSQLQAGDTVILVNKSASAANGTKDKYFAAVNVDLFNDTVVATKAVNLILGGKTDQWTLTTAGGSKVGHKATTLDMSDTETTFKISFNDSNVVITSNTKCTKSGKEGYPSIFYNSSGSGRFAFYTSTTMQPVQLFKKLPEGEGPAVKVTGVTLDSKTLTLRIGNTKQLKATVSPEDAKNKNVSWGSVDTAIVTIADGLITAVQKGTTKVWVKTEDGDFTDTCVVTVKESASLPDVTWNILQTADSLKEGVKVLFGNAAKDYVMGLYNYDVANSNIRGAAATYGEQRHTVTASESNAYIVHRDGEKIYFEDIDGRYLYMYNTNKNLSASTSLNNQAKWTVSYQEDTASIKSVYSSSYAIYFNKTATNPMYCTYSNFDANHARILLYTSNAPEWKAPEKHPELTLLNGEDTIRGLLDWGKVVYDDSWGTEVNPYEESKTITIKTKDISDKIYLSLAKGVDFTSTAESIAAKGGSFSIQFSVKDKGTYQDTLFVSCGERKDTIVLKAQAVKQEETKPTITFSARQINLRADTTNNFGDIASFTFSTQNLVKNLYIKWENSTGNSIPQGESDEVEILAGEEYVYYGESTNMGNTDQTNTEVIIDVTAYMSGTYTSTLLFYTPDADDKSKNAFEERVTITIVVDNGESTALNSYTLHSTPYTKIMHNNHLLILHNNKWYMVNGQIVK